MRFMSLVLLILALQGPPATELGSIQGTVTRAGNNEPISGATVTLWGGPTDPQALQALVNMAARDGIVINTAQGATTDDVFQALSTAAVSRGFAMSMSALQTQLSSLSGRTPPATTTDRDGRYSFKDLQPGNYTVQVQKDTFFGKPEGGYPQQTGAIDVRVAGKEQVDGSLSMTPGAVIAGRVFDQNGQLMSTATVQLFRAGYSFGHALLIPLASRVTDDRGEYRLFWVPPGDYYVAATPRATPAAPGGPATASAPVKTFYPGVNSVGEARIVSFRGGEETTGVDIRLRPSQSFKISGQINSLIPPPQPGAPGVNAAVLMLVNRDPEIPDDSTPRQIARVPLLPTVGNFEVANILPGFYDLFASIPDPSGQIAGGQSVAWGRARFDLSDRDLTGIAITVPASTEVKGTVSAVGAKLPGGLRVQLLPADAAMKIPAYALVQRRSALVTPEGTFAVPAVPEGRFRIGAVAGLGPDQYIAEVRQNAQNVFDSGFEVSAKNNGPVEIVIGSGTGIVNGLVMETATKPFAGATVVLVPEARRRQNVALYMVANSDYSGRFTLRGVPPGEYKVFAWESVPPFAYQNTAFLVRHEERGKIVRVNQSGSANVELTVIPLLEK